jgi:hypothetical protein
MNVIFETQMPLASLKQDAVDFFSGLHGLVPEERDGALTFVSRAPGEWVRVEVEAGEDGTSRVTVDTQQLGSLVQEFRARVAPDQPGGQRQARLAAGEDLERYRAQAGRQPAAPDSYQASSPGTGGGPMRG